MFVKLRHLRNILLAGGLLFVTLLFGIWLGFPLLAGPVTAALLERAELDLTHLDLRRPGLTRLQVDRFAARHRASGSLVEAHEVTLYWHPSPARIRQGELERVQIGRLDVTVGAADPTGTETPVRLESGPWLDALPLKRLGVDHLHLTGTIAGATVTFDGGFDASRQTAQTLELQLLPGAGGVLSLDLADPDRSASVSLQQEESFVLRLAGDGALDSAGTLRLGYHVHDLHAALEGRLGLADLGGTLHAPRGRLESSGSLSWADGSANYAASAELGLELASATLRIANDATVALDAIHWRETAIGTARIRSTEEARIALRKADFTALQLALTVDDGAGATADVGVMADASGEIRLDVHGADLPLAAGGLPDRITAGSWPIRAGRLELTGRLMRSVEGRFSGHADSRLIGLGADLDGHRLRDARGSARLDWNGDEVAISAVDLWVGRTTLTPGAAGSEAIVVTDARLTGDGAIVLAPTATSMIDAMNFESRLQIERIAREGLTLHSIRVDSNLHGKVDDFLLSLEMNADAADLGTELTELSCRGRLRSIARIKVEDCSARILGGETVMPAGHFDFDSGDGWLPLAVRELDVAAVLALMQQPALSGSGTLDGSLPLRFAAWVPAISDGWLAARPPGGVLTYDAGSEVIASMEQPAMRLAMRAVGDLRYQTLESRVTYQDDGQLTLEVALLGSNPEVEDGRPIQLNLNVTQNVLDLLQSLRLSEQIEDHVRQRSRDVQP